MKNKKIQKLFFEDYFSSVKILLDKIDYEKLIKISDFVEKSIKSKKKIFVAGNGGSASVTNHILCDFNKVIKLSSKYKMITKVYTIANSIELITAISNDIKYENIFDFQLENYANKGDVVFALVAQEVQKTY